MNYRLDKKNKNNRIKIIIITIIILSFLIYFRSKVYSALSNTSMTIFRPVLVLGDNVGNRFKNISSFFYSKKSLLLENNNLKIQLAEKQAAMANYNGIMDDNSKMMEILGRKNENNNLVVSAILSKPNHSPYDTIIIDIGADKNIAVDDIVFACGNIPNGRVSTIYEHSSKIVLFSTPGESTQVVVPDKDVFMQIIGRGGGNFEMILPRDFIIEPGTEVNLPGITPYVIGTVANIISDPRDVFTKALLVSPVNVQELEFVEVQK